MALLAAPFSTPFVSPPRNFRRPSGLITPILRSFRV
ncbi:hypothetical protein COLO4_15921 [Corchorus olitorius]|uniref:Uncharacterized protein n=1 Tax=Corchorus olitorius TaxID=93759 RepID=A0A1R3JKQ7_9ROSI|nr:hypothetical protein COLO4_15921 [Corchorus olitorius]